MTSTRLLYAALFLALAGVAVPASGQSVADASAPSPTGSALRAGETVSGSLDASDRAATDGTYYDDWVYVGTRGERLTLTLRSADFDAYLRFGRMDGGRFVQTAENDDGGQGSDSVLQVTLPADGEYVVRVNTMIPERGAYTLEVASRRR